MAEDFDSAGGSSEPGKPGAEKRVSPRGTNRLVTIADVNRYIARVMRKVHNGKLSPAQGQALSTLGRTLMAGLAMQDGHERLAQIESLLAELKAEKDQRDTAKRLLGSSR